MAGDFGAPVAQNVNSGGGLQTLSALMDMKSKQIGIQQQQQALQTGQATQQSAKAKATVDTQSAKENQALAQLMQDPVGGGLIDGDGNPTAGGEAVVLKAAPTTGADAYGKLVTAARMKTESAQAINNLNMQQRQEVASTVAGAAAGARSPDDIQAAIDTLVAQKKGTPSYNDYKTISDAAMYNIRRGSHPLADPAAVEMAGAKAPLGEEPWRQAALNVGRTVLGAQAVVGSGGIANPQNVTNAAGQAQLSNPITGARTAPEMGPGTSNPSTPTVAAQTTRATGTAGSDIDRANEVASLQQQSSAAIPLTKRIDELSHEINSGNLAKKISETGNWLGFSSVNEARSQLNKDLGQVKGLAVAKSGSDSRAATILEGYPTDTTPENTTHAAMDYIRGTARQNLARGKLLSQYQTEDPQGLKGFQAADNVMSGSTNPLMHEYLALKPAEQAGFYRRNFSTAQEAQSFKDQVNALKKHSRVFDSQ